MNFFKNFTLALASVFLVLLLLEGVGLIVNHVNRHEKRKTVNGTFIIPDRLLGYKPTPGGRFTCIYNYDSEQIYNVCYTIDQYGRRVTPVENPGGRKKFALFFGCSHIFGEGVEDNETLPCYFGRNQKAYVPYNYGFMGYGPQQMLMGLCCSPIRDEVPEQEGVGFFLYIGHWHVYRAIGEMVVSNGWGSVLPCFTIDSEDRLVSQGTFRNARPVLSRIYKILGASRFLKAFGITFPPFLTDAHYELTARIIQAAYENYKRVFRNDNFYVIISPATHPSHIASSIAIIPHLEKAGIKYLDYSRLIDLNEDRYKIKGDGHPNPLANRIIAEQLAVDMKKGEDQ